MGPLSLLTIVRESVARHCKDIKMHSPAAKSPGTRTPACRKITWHQDTRMPQNPLTLEHRLPPIRNRKPLETEGKY